MFPSTLYLSLSLSLSPSISLTIYMYFFRIKCSCLPKNRLFQAFLIFHKTLFFFSWTSPHALGLVYHAFLATREAFGLWSPSSDHTDTGFYVEGWGKEGTIPTFDSVSQPRKLVASHHRTFSHIYAGSWVKVGGREGGSWNPSTF